MHYFYREMDFRETEKPTLILTMCKPGYITAIRDSSII